MQQTFLLISILIGGFLIPLLGQDIPPPTAPFVAPLPENAHWIVTIKPNKDASTKAGMSTLPTPVGNAAAAPKRNQLETIDVTKTGELKRDVLSYSSGMNLIFWYTQGLLLFPNGNGQPTIFNLDRVTGGSMGDTIRSAGYTGLRWLDLKNYDAVVKFEDRLAYHYQMAAAAPPAPIGLPRAVPIQNVERTVEAWIDVKTGQPLGYTDVHGKLYTYHFLEPPSVPLTLPDPYRAGLVIYQASRTR